MKNPREGNLEHEVPPHAYVTQRRALDELGRPFP